MTDRPRFACMRAIWPPMAVSAVVLLSAGCSGAHSVGGDKTSAPSSASATEQTPAETPTEQTPTDDGDTFTVGLHEPARWTNGVEVRLGSLARGVSSDVAAPEHAPMVRFNVTVTNGSKGPLDLSLIDIECPTGDGMIFDDGLDSAPSRHALPGKSVAWASACAFGRTEHDFQLEVTPGSNDYDTTYRTAIFTGQLP